ncbi:unnamed protein product [Gadus morhua 'NCC']
MSIDANTCTAVNRSDANTCSAVMSIDANTCTTEMGSDANTCTAVMSSDANTCSAEMGSDANTCSAEMGSDANTCTALMGSDANTCTAEIGRYRAKFSLSGNLEIWRSVLWARPVSPGFGSRWPLRLPSQTRSITARTPANNAARALHERQEGSGAMMKQTAADDSSPYVHEYCGLYYEP